MRHKLEVDGNPCVDYSVFGPHGYRMLKTRLVEGLVLDADNATFVRRQHKCPPNWGYYVACHNVWAVALMGLGQGNWGLFRRYLRKLETWYNLYPKTYPLLYQADVRARSELWNKKWRQGYNLYRWALQRGPHAVEECPFDPEYPVEYCLSAICRDRTW